MQEQANPPGDQNGDRYEGGEAEPLQRSVRGQRAMATQQVCDRTAGGVVPGRVETVVTAQRERQCAAGERQYDTGAFLQPTAQKGAHGVGHEGDAAREEMVRSGSSLCRHRPLLTFRRH